jgi:hypothetical protein
MVLDSVFSTSARLWIFPGESISFLSKGKNKNVVITNGKVKSISVNSIIIQQYSESYVKNSVLSLTSKLSGVRYLTLTLKEETIKPENITGCIVVAHESFFEDGSIPYHLGIASLYAIEKVCTITMRERKGKKATKVYGYSEALPSQYSPLPDSLSLPLEEKKNCYVIYDLQAGCRALFVESLSRKGGYKCRSTKPYVCSIFQINHLFMLLKVKTEEAFKSISKQKSAKLSEERGDKVHF